MGGASGKGSAVVPGLSPYLQLVLLGIIMLTSYSLVSYCMASYQAMQATCASCIAKHSHAKCSWQLSPCGRC